MDRPIANARTLKDWRCAIRERERVLTEELKRLPRSQRHWNESLDMHLFNDCVAQIQMALAAIDGLTSQATERHANGETGSQATS